MAKSRKNNFFLILLISITIIIFCRLILTELIGSKGVTFFGVSNEMFFLFGFPISYGIEKSISLMIENRIFRKQYDNASRVFKSGFLVTISFAFFLTIIYICMAKKVCNDWFEAPLSYMSFKVMIPALFLFVLVGLVRGFFGGYGLKNIVNQSYLIFAGSYLLFVSIFSKVMSGYGIKVSTLLRQSDYEFSYAATGASIGLLIAAVLTFGHALVCFLLFNKRTYFGESREYSKSVESISSLIISVFLNGLISFGIMFSVVFCSFINSVLVLGGGTDKTSVYFTFGEYYGKTFPICSIVILGVSMFAYMPIKKAISAIKRDEYRNAREKLQILIHRCVSISSFATAMVIVMGPDLIDFLFASNGQSTMTYLQIEAILIGFVVLAIVCSELLLSLKYDRLIIIGFAIGLLIHIVLLLILNSSGVGIYGLIISNIVAILVVSVILFFVVCRCFQYTQEWFRCFIISILSALVSGLIALMINKLVLTFGNSLIAFIVSFIFGAFTFILLLLLLRGYTIDELEESAVGRFMILMGKTFKLM